MQEYWVTVVDTTQIQSYIFGSNRLPENIGASWLVKQATGAWALEVVNEVAPRNNITDVEQNTLHPATYIENGAVDAEVIYAAGGNVLVIFAGEQMAHTFIHKLSRKVMCEAPGLQLLFSFQKFNWDTKSAQLSDAVAATEGGIEVLLNGDKQPKQLYSAVMEAFDDLETQKGGRAHNVPLLGLGVTMACQSTGMPATRLHTYASEKPRPVSGEILAKMEAADISHDDLMDRFETAVGNDYDFPRDFDKLGRSSGEQSYIAVVHADGNGLGQLMIETGKKNRDDNRKYITAVRGQSAAVAKASQAAMDDTLKLLSGAEVITRDKDEHQQDRRSIVRRVDYKNDDRDEVVARIILQREGKERGRWLLPFRPLVYGGDDTTFVCDGRIGVTLAVEYLTQFREHATKELERDISASAGVAIVKSHYPFARAYELAEELCKGAKKFRAQEKWRTNKCQGSYLDWHFASSGLMGDIKDIRGREYAAKVSDGEDKPGSLCLRPLNLDTELPTAINEHTIRCWAVLEKALNAFQGEEWAERRNKVKALRDALRQGKDAVERFCLMYRQDQRVELFLPELSIPINNVEDSKVTYRKYGWVDSIGKEPSYCAYFDAIELADFYIPLIQHTTR